MTKTELIETIVSTWKIMYKRVGDKIINKEYDLHDGFTAIENNHHALMELLNELHISSDFLMELYEDGVNEILNSLH